MFPPGKSGGLIEAMLITCTGFSNPYRFPPGKSGGLIEAAYPAREGLSSYRTVFPPGKSGGLIEATVTGTCGSQTTPGFRRVNPAASLKRYSRAHPPQRMPPVSAG